jgi:hypothetical protein
VVVKYIRNVLLRLAPLKMQNYLISLSQLLVLMNTMVAALHYLKWGLTNFVLPFLQQKIIIRSACGAIRKTSISKIPQKIILC